MMKSTAKWRILFTNLISRPRWKRAIHPSIGRMSLPGKRADSIGGSSLDVTAARGIKERAGNACGSVQREKGSEEATGSRVRSAALVKIDRTSGRTTYRKLVATALFVRRFIFHVDVKFDGVGVVSDAFPHCISRNVITAMSLGINVVRYDQLI